MADFLTAYNRTSQFEGGYSDDADDNGNWSSGKKGIGILIGSNKGVSAPVLASFLNRVITVADMKSLTTETAQAIYNKLYWQPVGADEITNQGIANRIYDTAVNMGVLTAIHFCENVFELKQDGITNDKILSLINDPKKADVFIEKYKIERIKYYLSIVDRNPSQIKYLKGWIKRAIQ